VQALLAAIGREFPEFGTASGTRNVVRVSRAPGRLDVMGGSAEFGGGMTCSMTLDCGAAAAMTPRQDDRQMLFYFDPRDGRHFRISLTEVVTSTPEEMKLHLGEDVYSSIQLMTGCFALPIGKHLIDLQDRRRNGFDLAVASAIPPGAGVASRAALVAAILVNFREHFLLIQKLTPMGLAALCHDVLQHCDPLARDMTPALACCNGRAGTIFKHEGGDAQERPALPLPRGIRIIGIDTGVRRDPLGGQFERTRTAARMGQIMILAKMREMGEAAGMKLIADPMKGFLANLALDDYKKYFRSFLPEAMRGADFHSKFGSPGASRLIEDDVEYGVQSATDHHVHEPVRVKNFVQFMEQATALAPHSPQRSVTLDKAGHLMYASHISCTRDAKLGAPEADLLVDMVRKNERAGLYGAKITARGQGGTVAVLANDTEKASESIGAIAAEYQRQTGKVAEFFWKSSPGALEAGTEMVNLD
jgi:galactokinase